MNEEQETKINWIFNSMRFLLEDSSTFDETEKNKILNDADRIELDYKVEETKLENKTENALGRKNE